MSSHRGDQRHDSCASVPLRLGASAPRRLGVSRRSGRSRPQNSSCSCSWLRGVRCAARYDDEEERIGCSSELGISTGCCRNNSSSRSDWQCYFSPRLISRRVA
ncbi:unnamed protein product [Soboliphyme baturini]|uniref:Uncharacterized protein n=1 Tax=Soboliphyme baturini TaxID=241478 RepID=A0A183INZ5_9BILA|nr:unnamed protein product [Soboliphyme baturini]